MLQTNQQLPRLSHTFLLPFLYSQGQFHFVVQDNLSDYSFLGGVIPDQDEGNPLPFAFALLSQDYSGLLNLSTTFSNSQVISQDIEASKWILDSVAQLPRLISSSSLILPLRIATDLTIQQIVQIIENECHGVSLMTLNQLRRDTNRDISDLMEQMQTRLLKTEKEDNYFGLLNCSIPTSPTCNVDLISLYLIGSVLNDQDRWKNFHVTVKQLPSSEDISNGRLKGVMISGSMSACYDKVDWVLKLKSYLKNLSSHKKIKMLGTCFGHQMLALALGGKVGKIDKGVFIKKQEQIEFKSTFCSTGYNSSKIFQRKMLLQELHGDEIKAMPTDYSIYASSESCKYECVGRGTQILSSQFHPEYTHALVKSRYLPRFKDAMSQDEYSELIKAHRGCPDNWSFREIQYRFLNSE